MEPAFKLLLSDEQHAQLGELTAIIGQVDEILIRTVAHLLTVERMAANRIMGATKISDNAGIWSELVRAKTTDEKILWLVSHAMVEIQSVSAARNDFVHAWFQMVRRDGAWADGVWKEGVWCDGVWGDKAVLEARRVKSDKPRPLSELPIVRDRAARLSCLVAHIWHLLTEAPATNSPWLERLAPTLPPRPKSDGTPRQGKGQKARPQA
ncbi:hypothetical protein [Mesorhizobium sp. WSM3860]|uniref:hypothetical protein n=1 Tax=Mesorhizobium sp. WSM3860 TaxID=2029403 RepID=UPI000BAF6D8F|nr:hypothetical protein [Mesorhizobium sp. WSM3860]PBC02521.1 hypothetical protein CK220_20650 [Mesorhizobium sp. WSM3860]